jgi:uncharacterized membrane protein YfcA
MDVPFGYGRFAVAALTVAVGYLVFAITGFGAALLTVPVLSHFFPLPFVLPLAVLLDVGASLVVGIRFQRDADRRELKLMVPSSLIGAVLGVTMLVSLPREAALTGLGVFTLAYGVYNLRQGTAFQPVSSAWAPVAAWAEARWARCSVSARPRTRSILAGESTINRACAQRRRPWCCSAPV